MSAHSVLLRNGPADGFQWSVMGGALPDRIGVIPWPGQDGMWAHVFDDWEGAHVYAKTEEVYVEPVFGDPGWIYEYVDA